MCGISGADTENLESWLTGREATERPVPGYVNEHLRSSLEGGILCARAEDLGRPRCVMIHPAVLPEPQLACLRQLAPIATALDFSLAGGTAVALHLATVGRWT